MASLQYAKESIVLKTVQDVADNDKRTQSLELMGSVVWRAKSAVLTASLADALLNNTKLTALNLSECNLGDGALCSLADALQHNATLFDLNLSHNKLGRPGLVHLAKRLTDNTGLMHLDLIGHRINSEVASAFVEMFRTNLTLCKLIWKLDTPGYNLRFTELTNRNTEIDRCVRDAADFTELLPEELRGSPPELEPRVVPDPDNEELGMELGGEGQMVWCQVEGKWSLGTVVGSRKRKVVVMVEEEEHDFEPSSLTQVRRRGAARGRRPRRPVGGAPRRAGSPTPHRDPCPPRAHPPPSHRRAPLPPRSSSRRTRATYPTWCRCRTCTRRRCSTCCSAG